MTKTTQQSLDSKVHQLKVSPKYMHRKEKTDYCLGMCFSEKKSKLVRTWWRSWETMCTCSFMRSTVYDYILSLMLTQTQMLQPRFLIVHITHTLVSSDLYRREKLIFPLEKHRQKGESLLPPMGYIYLRSRSCSMASDDAHHHNQGQLWWGPCGTPQSGFLMSEGEVEVMLPISFQWKCLFVSLFSTTSSGMNLSVKLKHSLRFKESM